MAPKSKDIPGIRGDVSERQVWKWEAVAGVACRRFYSTPLEVRSANRCGIYCFPLWLQMLQQCAHCGGLAVPPGRQHSAKSSRGKNMSSVHTVGFEVAASLPEVGWTEDPGSFEDELAGGEWRCLHLSPSLHWPARYNGHISSAAGRYCKMVYDRNRCRLRRSVPGPAHLAPGAITDNRHRWNTTREEGTSCTVLYSSHDHGGVYPFPSGKCA